MNSLVVNALVLVGFVAGGYAAGPVGAFAGGVAAFVGCLFAGEQSQSGRSADGFWLRHRGEIVAFAGIAAGVLVGSALVRGFWGVVAGVAAGTFLGRAVAAHLGWAGEAVDRELDVRTGYAAVLAAAAASDGPATDRERMLIAEVSRGLFAEFGFGGDADVLPTVDRLLAAPPSAAEAGAFTAGIGPDGAARLRLDVCRVLYAAGDPGPAAEAWLTRFRDACGPADWSVLGIFTRAGADGRERRAAALAALGLGPDATDPDVRAAYRGLALTYHPDRQDEAPAHVRELVAGKMAAVNDAYEYLTKPGGAGPLYFCGRDGAAFTPTAGAGFACACWLCGQKLRASDKAVPATVRCPMCRALAGWDHDPTAGP